MLSFGFHVFLRVHRINRLAEDIPLQKERPPLGEKFQKEVTSCWSLTSLLVCRVTIYAPDAHPRVQREIVFIQSVIPHVKDEKNGDSSMVDIIWNTNFPSSNFRDFKKIHKYFGTYIIFYKEKISHDGHSTKLRI